MKQLTTILAFVLAISLSASAFSGRDELKEGNDPEATVTVSSVPVSADALLFTVHVEEFKDPFNVQVNLPNGVDPSKVRVKTSNIGPNLVLVVVDKITQSTDDEDLVDTFVLVGITEDDLSGDVPRMANAQSSVPDNGGDDQQRIAINHNNPGVVITNASFATADQAIAIERTSSENSPEAITSINEVSGIVNSDVKVFPNPTNGLVNVNFNTAARIDRVQVLSMVGQVVQIVPLPQKNNQIDLSELPVGVYFVEAQSGNTKVVKRIVVDR